MKVDLLDLLVEHSYRRSARDEFELSSGKRSNFYIDCKTTTMRPEAGPLIGAAAAELIPLEADAIGGLTLGADAIAYAISAYMWYVQQRRLGTFTVRKTPKTHGTRRYIEGNLGTKVVVVDDVVTTGSSTIDAIRRCQEENVQVVAVVVLVDREENDGMANVRRAAGAGVPVTAIFKKAALEARWQQLHGNVSGAAADNSSPRL